MRIACIFTKPLTTKVFLCFKASREDYEICARTVLSEELLSPTIVKFL